MLFLPSARSAIRGKNSTHLRGILIWNQLPSSIKSSKSVIELLKTNLKQLGKVDCGCVIFVFSLMHVFIFISSFLLAFARLVRTLKKL